MANSTDVYWDIEGTSLQTYAWNITTQGGNRYAPPPLRGESVTVPYRRGTVYQKSVPDGRTITLNMWVQGTDSDGKIPLNEQAHEKFQRNYAQLRNLIWQPGRQITLTKRWKNFGSGTVLTASAKAKFAGGMDPTMTGAGRGTFSVDFYLDDPFFYGPEETVAFTPSGSTINISPTIKGDYETTKIFLDLTGARTNPRFTNLSLNSIYVDLAYVLNVSNTATIDVDAWTARQNPLGTNDNLLRYLTYNDENSWFRIQPGVQNLRLSSASGTTTANLRYQPAYI